MPAVEKRNLVQKCKLMTEVCNNKNIITHKNFLRQYVVDSGGVGSGVIMSAAQINDVIQVVF